MNFFAEQARARRQSRYLTFLFTLSVIAIVVFVDVLAALAIIYINKTPVNDVLGITLWLGQYGHFLILISLATVAVIGLASLYKMVSLRSGGGQVARDLGGVRIQADTRDRLYKRLYNVVEEMAIASSVPMPEVYVLEHELGINAFAAGYTPSDAAVAVTRGTLDALSRDELQGVIAHEFSHILNGDMRVNIRLMGLLFGILFVSLIGYQLLRVTQFSSRNDDNKSGTAIFMIGLGLVVIGSIGVFFGRLIQAAISRQREYLADASAVQFTRQTSGIAGALKKIAALEQGSYLQTAHVTEVSHMLFASGLSLSDLWQTHPPLLKRIAVLEPQFNPAEIQQIADDGIGEQIAEPFQASSEPSINASMAGVSGLTGLVSTQLIGRPAEAQRQQAIQLRNDIPQGLQEAAYSQSHAVPLILSLLLDNKQPIRDLQLNLIATHCGGEVRTLCTTLAEQRRGLANNLRLPLLQMAFPMVKNRPITYSESLLDLIDRLIEADGVVDTFEFLLSCSLRTYLHDARHPHRDLGNKRLLQLPDAIRVLFAAFSGEGHQDDQTAKSAYRKGISYLIAYEPRLKSVIEQKKLLEYTPIGEWLTITMLYDALLALDKLVTMDKELILNALAEIVNYDNKVTLVEAELFRTVCVIFHCPLPPFIEQAVVVE